MKKLLSAVWVSLSLLNGSVLPLWPGRPQAGFVGRSESPAFPLNAANRFAFHTVAPASLLLPADGQKALLPSLLYFQENRGQADASIGFLARVQTGCVGLTSTGMIWQAKPALKSQRTALPAAQMRLVKGNAQAPAEGIEALAGKINYLLGSEAKQWQTNIPTYAQVKYHQVYPGIDLLYYFKDQSLEYDFVIAPGAEVKRIRLAFTGSRKVIIEENGDLVIYTKGGELRQHKPFAYQTINGEKREIPVQFTKNKRGEIGFQVASYDPQQPLIIDPTLSFSSYLGGSDTEAGTSIAVDAAGNIYVAGNVHSPDFPLSANAYQKTLSGGDLFITKLNPAGNAILFSTFLGGSETENATGIAVDANGNVTVTGSTASANFPTTAGAYQNTLRNADAFITKLNATGSDLVFSTLLGGSGNEVSHGVAVDSAGNAYVTGSSTSDNFPTTTGAFQANARGGGLEAFVTKMNATGTQLVYSSYLGGGGIEAGTGIVVDNASNAYVTGFTTSSNFSTTAGVLQTGYNGATNLADAFVTKVNPAGTALVYSTYLGGKADDMANTIAIDSAGNAYVAGTTSSNSGTNDFPTTAGAYQTTYAGSSVPGPKSDAFVAKLNPLGTALVYSTYLGGNGADNIFGIAVNSQGAAFVTGSTASTNLPTAPDAFRMYAGAIDAFVAQLDAAGATLSYSSYLGGGSNDAGAGITLDSLGNVYVVGTALSSNFPVFPSALQPTAKGGRDAFVAVFKNGTNRLADNVTAASYSRIPMARESIVSAFGGNLATQTAPATDTDPNTPGIQLPTTLAGTTVKVKDNQGVERFAPLFFVSPLQINYQIPPGTPIGAGLVTITAEDGTVSLGLIQIVDVAPDLFSADSTGKGPAVGYAVRVKANNAQIEEPIVKSTAPNKWESVPIDLGPDLGANTDQVFLILFGTGIRFRQDPPQVNAKIGGIDARVDYAKDQCCFIGVDQVNLLIPRTLIGKGEVDVVLTVEGKTTSPLKIAIK